MIKFVRIWISEHHILRPNRVIYSAIHKDLVFLSVLGNPWLPDGRCHQHHTGLGRSLRASILLTIYGLKHQHLDKTCGPCAVELACNPCPGLGVHWGSGFESYASVIGALLTVSLAPEVYVFHECGFPLVSQGSLLGLVHHPRYLGLLKREHGQT